MPHSSNWLVLKQSLTTQKLPVSKDRNASTFHSTKRRRVDTGSEAPSEGSIITQVSRNESTSLEHHDIPANRDSVQYLSTMVRGQIEYSPAQKLLGKFVAIDCEMVGIAGKYRDPSVPGKRNQDESSLARVSIVNFHGAVQLDVFVQQRERVTDWRTEFSGVRESDMIKAKPFVQVQKLVSDMLKDRILVGHAVHNDLKVLLLSHPRNMTRDTQSLASSHSTSEDNAAAAVAQTPRKIPSRLTKYRKPALRKLVRQELGIEIQKGEHSSVVDARAAMAIYRLHRKSWDRGFRTESQPAKASGNLSDVAAAENSSQSGATHEPSLKRKQSQSYQGAEGAAGGIEGVSTESNPADRKKRRKKSSTQRKGPSSGLSVVVKKYQGGSETKHVMTGTREHGTGKKVQWWATLA